MAIIWRNSMEVGKKEIDDDHQHLVRIINSLEDTLDSTIVKEDMIKGLKELEKYTIEHFAREERIMKTIGYPRYFQHFKEHYNLKNQLKDIQSKILLQFEDGNKQNYDDLIDLLRHWLLDHVIKEDLLMRPHFKH